MSCNPEQSEPGNPGPIIHVRADSDSCLEELFAFGLKPPGAQPMMQKPLRLRNLPQSFFNPPQSGGSRSPSCHSRESSFDNSSLHQQQPYSPMQQPVGSPQPQSAQVPQPVHTRAHSSPANLQQTLAAVQQQQQQHFHLRQPSCDVSGNADLGPLPPGWEPARTPQGVLYFMNHITKTTQWEDPRLQIQQQNIKEQQLGQMTNSHPQTAQQKQLMMSRPLPQGWEQGVTPEGEQYFINHVTKTTTWFDPRIPINMQSGPSVRIGSAQVQQQQQMLRLQRLENERRVLQQRQAELEKMEQNRLMRQQNIGGRGFHENIQAAVNATQEMLMRQNLNGDGAPSPQDPFHGLNHRPLEMQHIREESADSGLGMGSNFNLGSIPEDISGMDGLDSMDTGDLDTTLTDPATPTPTTTLIGCGIPQQQQQQVVDTNSMDSGDALIPNLQADLGEEFQNDLMQTILTSQNQQANPNEGPLTWL